MNRWPPELTGLARVDVDLDEHCVELARAVLVEPGERCFRALLKSVLGYPTLSASSLSVSLPAHEGVRSRALSRDGRCVAELHEVEAVVVGLATGAVTLRVSCAPEVCGIALNDDGSLLALIGPEHELRLFALGSQRALDLQFHDVERRRLGDHPTWGWSSKRGGEAVREHHSIGASAEQLVIAPDGQSLLTIARRDSDYEYYYGGGYQDEAAMALLYPLAEPWLPEVLFSDRASCEIDYSGGRPSCARVEAAAFSSEGQRIALLFDSGEVACWDRGRRELDREQLWARKGAKARLIAFALASSCFACVGGSRLRVASDAQLNWRTIKDARLADARALALSHEGTQAAVALPSGEVLRYDLERERELDTLAGVGPLASLVFDPAGRLLARREDHAIVRAVGG